MPKKAKLTIKIGEQYQASLPAKSSSKDLSTPLWDCRMLPENEVTEFIDFAKKHWSSAYKFDESTALRLLTSLNYSLISAKAALLVPTLVKCFIEDLHDLECNY